MNRKLFLIILTFTLSVGFCFAQPVATISDKTIIIQSEKIDFTTHESFKTLDFAKISTKGEFETFMIGEGSQSITEKRSIFPFAINKYETTYDLWYFVRTYAEKNLNYHFQNPGQEGTNGRRGAKPTEANKNLPVTTITWYDTIVWCNALSEMQGKTPCYTYNGAVLRNSNETAACDLCTCVFFANGYRLPTETEWEYAARLTSNGFSNGALASGHNSSKLFAETELAWFSENAFSAQIVGTAGNPLTEPAELGSGNANYLGIFDMSGNVLEYCFDWFADYKPSKDGERYLGPLFGSERISRGGSFSPYTPFIGTGDRYSFDPNEAYNYNGFRLSYSETN